MDDCLLNVRSILLEQQRVAGGRGVSESVDLNQVLEQILETEARLPEGIGVTITRDYGKLPPVILDVSKFNRIMVLLLKNAVEAINEQKERIQTGPLDGHIILRTLKSPNGIGVEIDDNGAGINPEHLRRVFEDGYTTKKDHLGSGLHYCANTLKEMSGSIRLSSDGPGMGTRVSLFIPYRQAMAVPVMLPSPDRAHITE